MRTLVITQNITVDGSIEMLDDWFGTGGQDVSDLTAHLQNESRESDAFLVGRRTFVDMRGYWPEQTDDTTGVTAHLNQVAKYVVSSTLTDPEWANSTIIAADVVDRVRALKNEPGRDIVVTGSITLCHTLIEAGLIDQYRLYTYPAVQGRGRRLFPDGHRIPSLSLLRSTTFTDGVTYARYAPA